MKERIFLCLLLATVSLLCSCSEQRYVPDSISSHAEITAKSRTTRSEKSTTLPGPEPQEKELTMIVNGMALDVSWEDNEMSRPGCSVVKWTGGFVGRSRTRMSGGRGE